MKTMPFSFTSLLLIGLLWSACGGSEPSDAQSTETTEQDSLSFGERGVPVAPAPECEVAGEVLDGNRLWMAERNLLAVIKADESTTEEGYGPGHRKLEFYRGVGCELAFSETLQESGSPDYPYYIGDIQYNKASGLLGVRGYYDLYVCALEDNFALTALQPRYRTERLTDDPQSGMIQHLEVWEDYLIGYAQDYGAFAFDCQDPDRATALLPFAEWQNEETGQYHSLFLVPSEGAVQQAIMPHFNSETGEFSLHPLFDQPRAVSTNVPAGARNNRFLVLRGEGDAKAVYALDLGARARVSLPADVATRSTQEIIAWMRNR